jgi:hypothetical protein
MRPPTTSWVSKRIHNSLPRRAFHPENQSFIVPNVTGDYVLSDSAGIALYVFCLQPSALLIGRDRAVEAHRYTWNLRGEEGKTAITIGSG